MDLPLSFKNRNTCENKFTKQLQNLLCSPNALFFHRVYFAIALEGMDGIHENSVAVSVARGGDVDQRRCNRDIPFNIWFLGSFGILPHFLSSFHIFFSFLSFLFLSSVFFFCFFFFCFWIPPSSSSSPFALVFLTSSSFFFFFHFFHEFLPFFFFGFPFFSPFSCFKHTCLLHVLSTHVGVWGHNVPTIFFYSFLLFHFFYFFIFFIFMIFYIFFLFLLTFFFIFLFFYKL